MKYEVNFYECYGFIKSVLKDGETTKGVIFNTNEEADSYAKVMNEKGGYKNAERNFLYY